MVEMPQLPLDIGLSSHASFSNYLARENHAIHSQFQVQLDAGEPLIFLIGPSDSGKSHLLFAACNHLAQQQTPAAYLPLREYAHTEAMLLEGMESQTTLCLDDIDAICGNPAWEMALFNLINRMRELNHTLILTASQTPRNLTIDLPDLQSRLSAGLLLQLRQEDEETRRAILQLKGEERGLELSDEVCRYLFNHYRRDLGSLIRLLDQLDRAALVSQRRITIPFIKAWLTEHPSISP